MAPDEEIQQQVGSYIGQINIGNYTHAIGSTLYGICSTEAATAAKIAILNGFTRLFPGVTVHIKFTTANTVSSNVTLKIGTTDAKPITNPNGSLLWAANSIISFTYDGTDSGKWVINSSQIDTSNIQIDISQLSDVTFGNITSEGKITDSANRAVVTDANSTITAISLAVSDPTANGNSLSYIDSISQNAQGQISPTKKTIPDAGRGVSGVISLPTGNTETKFLREDGTWVVPNYTTNTDENVTQSPITSDTDVQYNILLKYTADNNQETRSVKFANGNNSRVTVNPHTGAITAPGGFIGKATSAGTADNVPWSGITGTKPSTLSGYGIEDAKINDGVITLGSNTIIPVTSVNGHSGSSVTVTAADLGLSSAMHYIGAVQANPITTAPTGDFSAGDVVTYSNSEYVYDGTNWRELGSESSFKIVQTAVSDPSVQNNVTATSFISSITQNTQGVIAATKANLPVASSSQLGIVKVSNPSTALTIDSNGVISHNTSAGYKHIPSGGSTGQFLGYSANGTATWVDNPNTHYTTKLVAGGSDSSAHAEVTSGNVYLRIFDDNIHRDTDIQLQAGTNMEITSTTTGIITFNNTYSYTLPLATSGARGGIQIGYSESGTNYAVQLDSEKAYVSVPWTDTKVTQALDNSSTTSFPILFSDNNTTVSTASITSSAKRNNSIYITPSTGEIHAAKFVGALDTNEALGTVANTTSLTFYHKSGSWKTLSINNTHTTVASVSDGVLTLISAVDENAALQMS